MRGKIARDLRRLAFARWNTLSKEYQAAFTLRIIYKQVKKEFYNEKR